MTFQWTPGAIVTLFLKSEKLLLIDGKVAYKIHTRNKLYRNFKLTKLLTKLYIDEKIYMEERNAIRKKSKKETPPSTNICLEAKKRSRRRELNSLLLNLLL